jgi:hypothetical protein
MNFVYSLFSKSTPTQKQKPPLINMDDPILDYRKAEDVSNMEKPIQSKKRTYAQTETEEDKQRNEIIYKNNKYSKAAIEMGLSLARSGKLENNAKNRHIFEELERRNGLINKKVQREYEEQEEIRKRNLEKLQQEQSKHIREKQMEYDKKRQQEEKKLREEEIRIKKEQERIKKEQERIKKEQDRIQKEQAQKELEKEIIRKERERIKKEYEDQTKKFEENIHKKFEENIRKEQEQRQEQEKRRQNEQARQQKEQEQRHKEQKEQENKDKPKSPKDKPKSPKDKTKSPKDKDCPAKSVILPKVDDFPKDKRKRIILMRKMYLRLHPDKNLGCENFAKEKIQELNNRLEEFEKKYKLEDQVGGSKCKTKKNLYQRASGAPDSNLKESNGIKNTNKKHTKTVHKKSKTKKIKRKY